MRKIDAAMKMLGAKFKKKSDLEFIQNVIESVYESNHIDIGDDELIDRFIDRCRMKGSSEGTISEYTRKLVALSASSEVYFLDMGTEDIETFLTEKKTSGCIASTLNAYIGCFRSFFGWLTDYEYIPKNPMNKIDSVKGEKKLKHAYTRQEIEKMREYFTHPRDRALIEFLLGCGVRASEACKIKYKDLDLNSSPCSVIVHGKGNKQRRIPVSDTAVVYLVKYLETRKPMFDEDSVFVTIRAPHQPLTSNAIKQMFAKASSDLGFHAHAHKFRRTYCSELVSHGMALAYAQKLMGHATPNTTMLYTNVKDNLVFAEFQKVSNF